MDVTGVLLAAGESGGQPDALRKDDDGTPWLETAHAALRDAGCREVMVVLGSDTDAALSLVPRGGLPVVATDWQNGQSAWLRVGLAAAATSSTDAVLLALPAPPTPSAAAGRRVIETAADNPRGTLARAHYGATAAHPVLLGRDHWREIADTVVGDMGIDAYLGRHLTVEVDCTDVGGGEDVAC